MLIFKAAYFSAVCNLLRYFDAMDVLLEGNLGVMLCHMTAMNDGGSIRHLGWNAFLELASPVGDDACGLAAAEVTLINDGRDTQVLLRDGSTIVFKGVTHVEAGFFG
jgi:hypothetical protein